MKILYRYKYVAKLVFPPDIATVGLVMGSNNLYKDKYWYK